MPNDLKQFYLNQNGMKIEWKFLVDSINMSFLFVNISEFLKSFI
jgi:hypothetical protein